MADKKCKINIKDIQLIAYDFDGVMTDNKVLVFEDGKEAVVCNRADGLAIQKIKELGIPQIILSTEKNQVVRFRARKLNIEVIQGIRDKKAALEIYCKNKKYNLKSVLYVGNDINDLEIMKLSGYSVAPQDAHHKIKQVSNIVIGVKGGNGVIRELYHRLIMQEGK